MAFDPVPVVAPKVGGVIANVAWTGGQRITRAIKPKSLYCFRPTDVGASMKMYQEFTKGLEFKFKGGKDVTYTLALFGKAVLKQLVKTGMDSIFYFFDPVSRVEKNILEHHASFSIDYIKTQTTAWIATGDSYEIENLEWSESLISRSISVEQQLALAKYEDCNDNGPLLWMHVAAANQSDSDSALRTLVNELQKMALTDFAGENVPDCTTVIAAKCKRLQTAKCLPSDMLSTICGISTKTTNEAFRTYFMGKKVALDVGDTEGLDFDDLVSKAD